MDGTPTVRSLSVNVRLLALASQGIRPGTRELAADALAEIERLHVEVERLRKVEAAARGLLDTPLLAGITRAEIYRACRPLRDAVQGGA